MKLSAMLLLFGWMEFHSINEITDVNFLASDDCALCTFNDMMDSRMMRSNLFPQLLIWFRMVVSSLSRLSLLAASASCACANVVMIHPGFSDVKETRDLLEYKPMKKEKKKKKKKRDHQVVFWYVWGWRVSRRTRSCWLEAKIDGIFIVSLFIRTHHQHFRLPFSFPFGLRLLLPWKSNLLSFYCRP